MQVNFLYISMIWSFVHSMFYWIVLHWSPLLNRNTSSSRLWTSFAEQLRQKHRRHCRRLIFFQFTWNSTASGFPFVDSWHISFPDRFSYICDGLQNILTKYVSPSRLCIGNEEASDTNSYFYSYDLLLAKHRTTVLPIFSGYCRAWNIVK